MNTGVFDVNGYKQRTQQEWQSVAPGWHKWLPFFSEWGRAMTEKMLDLAEIGPGHRVLDIAAGDGDQSMMAARRVGPDGSVLATDISPNLLAYAAASAQEVGLDNFKTRVMDGEHLELEDAAFDAVICRLGLMLMPRVNRVMSEVHRVLKSGGRVSAIVLSTPEKSPWLSIPATVALKYAQLPPPQPRTPGPFSLGAPGLYAEALHGAGFQKVETYRVAAPLRLASASACMEYLRDTAGGIYTILSPLDEDTQRRAWDEIEVTLGKLEGPGGFESPCEVIVGAGSKVAR
jgi:ubiquinone/menaquinone biosynthesis C-methylase UbiE